MVCLGSGTVAESWDRGRSVCAPWTPHWASIGSHTNWTTVFHLYFPPLFFFVFSIHPVGYLQSWQTPPGGKTITFFKRVLVLLDHILLPRDLDSADPLNAFHWEKASDVQFCECVQAEDHLVKMGNKQTIFTDEQLDAYQVNETISKTVSLYRIKSTYMFSSV